MLYLIKNEILKSKAHRTHVNEVDINYIRSITIDDTLIEGANCIQGEKVDVNNRVYFSTYVI
ncbi:MAG: aspartate 1-decarboxylase [Flavobacteriales bacterium]